MIVLVVGHRGVGKTSLVRRLVEESKRRGRALMGLDLDEEIERRCGRDVASLFASEGEAGFRRLEETTLLELMDEIAQASAPVVVVSLGAGYAGALPNNVMLLWLKRPTDGAGRIFLDRPRLDPQLAPLQEFASRAKTRDARFAEWADEVLVLPEGVIDNESASAESVFLGLAPGSIGGYLTLVPEEHGLDPGALARRLGWGVDGLELRDDILSDAQIRAVCDTVPASRLLLSFRSCRNSKSLVEHRAGREWDWPMELGACPWGPPPVASLHEAGADESPESAGQRLHAFAPSSHLKLAVEVRSLEALWEGHRWWARDPDRRSFLPRSVDGRWAWYRLRQKGHMKINFFRTSDGSAPDQPFFMEWLRAPHRPNRFAAIVGDPVRHSRTPTEHLDYFAAFGMPVVAIAMGETELDAAALDRLASLGLTHAAVTAPLKKRVAALVDGESSTREAVNTIARVGSGWRAANTDQVALSEWLAPIAGRRVVCWGGGGTRQAVLAAVPSAVAYSARRGTPLEGRAVADPEFLVWAVGRNRQGECTWPPAGWKPQRVYDLNYAEDSPGREYALSLGCEYESGIRMFRLQAEAQRAFWRGLARVETHGE